MAIFLQRRALNSSCLINTQVLTSYFKPHASLFMDCNDCCIVCWTAPVTTWETANDCKAVVFYVFVLKLTGMGCHTHRRKRKVLGALGKWGLFCFRKLGKQNLVEEHTVRNCSYFSCVFSVEGCKAASVHAVRSLQPGKKKKHPTKVLVYAHICRTW